MAKCILNCKPAPRQKGLEIFQGPEVHYGYPCEINLAGEVIADIPDAFLQTEIQAGRARLLDPEP